MLVGGCGDGEDDGISGVQEECCGRGDACFEGEFGRAVCFAYLEMRSLPVGEVGQGNAVLGTA